MTASGGQLPVGTVLDGELACLQPLKDGRVRCRFDRLSAFMVARAPHRPDANGLTVTVTVIVFDALAVRRRGPACRPVERAPDPPRGAARGRRRCGASNARPGGQPGAARRPGRRRLGGNRRQAHHGQLPLRAPQRVWLKLKSPAPRPRHHARDAAPPGPAARVPPVSDRPRTPCPTCGQAIKPDETDVVDAVEIGLLGPTFGGPSEPAEVRHAAFHPSCFPEGDPAWRRK